MRVGIDVDGVLRQTLEFALQCFYKDQPLRKYLLDESEIDKWELSRWFTNSLFLKMFENFLFNNINTSNYIFLNAEPYKDVNLNYQSLYDELKKMSCEIVIVTSQKKSYHKKATIDWLEKHNIKYDSIIFTKQKGNCNLDILIDDKIENCRDVYMTGGFPILRNQFWNKNSNRFYHTDTLLSIIDVVKLKKFT